MNNYPIRELLRPTFAAVLLCIYTYIMIIFCSMKSKISVTCGCPSHPFFNERDHEYPIKIYICRQESNPFLLMQIWQEHSGFPNDAML